MKLKFLKSILIGAVFGVALTACSVETDSNELDAGTHTFTFEDIYEGSNTSTVEVDMKALIDANEIISGKEIESVSVLSITLIKDDSTGFSEISSSKMQIMGEGEETPMVTVGVNTAMDGTSKKITLDLMDDVELEEYVAGGKIYLILDGNYSVDNEESQEVKVEIKFNVETVKK